MFCFGSLVPKGPKIGFPSYAQPIIGDLCARVSPKSVWRSVEYAKDAYWIGYWVSAFKKSSVEYFSCKLTVNGLTVDSTIPNCPTDFTTIAVSSAS